MERDRKLCGSRREQRKRVQKSVLEPKQLGGAVRCERLGALVNAKTTSSFSIQYKEIKLFLFLSFNVLSGSYGEDQPSQPLSQRRLSPAELENGRTTHTHHTYRLFLQPQSADRGYTRWGTALLLSSGGGFSLSCQANVIYKHTHTKGNVFFSSF